MATTVEPRKKPWAGLIVGVGLLAVMFCTCLGLFVVPTVFGMRGFKTKSRMSEARANLKAAFTAEKAYFAEFDRYDESIETVGFFPEKKNRYRYLFSTTGDSFTQGTSPDGGLHTGVFSDNGAPGDVALLAGIPPALLGEVGIKGTCPACDITIVAAGDIDGDPTIDVWSISTKSRTIRGEVVTPGQPYNHVDDTDK
jgi:type IV pilus assembly protein PilA